MEVFGLQLVENEVHEELLLSVAELNTSESDHEPHSSDSQDDLMLRRLADDMLREYGDVVTPDLPAELPPERHHTHRIDLLPGSQPPSLPLRRLSNDKQAKLQRLLSDMVRRKQIVPSSSPYGAPVVLVAKSDGTVRLVHDYRELNAQTVPDSYPLPRMDDLLLSAAKARVFSTLDLASGFFQIRMKAGDEHKTAFKTPIGLFHYRVMPQGLRNAPATFQRAMNSLLNDLVAKQLVVVYLDDLLVQTPTVKEHTRVLHELFRRLRRDKWFVKPSKCRLYRRSVRFLGHRIGDGRIAPLVDKVKAVQEFPRPCTVKALRSFLGLAQWFRSFLKSFSTVSAPLTDMLKHTKKPDGTKSLDNRLGEWTPAAVEAFEALKTSLSSAPTMRLPDASSPFQLFIDASSRGLGGVLCQNTPEGMQPVAYYSSKLSAGEAKLSSYELELLGLLRNLEHFAHLLDGRKIVVHTDNSALSYLLRTPQQSARLARWQDRLLRHDLTITHVSGKKNEAADALSRRPDYNQAYLSYPVPEQLAPPPDTPDVYTGELGTIFSLESGELVRKVEAAQTRDPQCRKILRNERDEANDRLQLINRAGTLYYHGDRIYVPPDKSLRSKIIYEAHDSGVGGHCSAPRCAELVSRVYFWPGLLADCTAYVAGCATCQRAKGGKHYPQGLLQPLPVPVSPFQSVAIDLVSALPMSGGYDSALVVIDRLTRFSMILPTTSTCTGESLAKLLFERVFSVFGCPRTIVSDRDVRFTSNFWATWAKIMKTRLAMSTAYHPQSDGLSERMIPPTQTICAATATGGQRIGQASALSPSSRTTSIAILLPVRARHSPSSATSRHGRCPWTAWQNSPQSASPARNSASPSKLQPARRPDAALKVPTLSLPPRRTSDGVTAPSLLETRCCSLQTPERPAWRSPLQGSTHWAVRDHGASRHGRLPPSSSPEPTSTRCLQRREADGVAPGAERSFPVAARPSSPTGSCRAGG